MSATMTADPELAEAPPKRGKKVLVIGLVVLLAAAGVAWYVLIGPAEPDLEVDGEIVTIEPMTTTVGEASLHHARVAFGVVLVEGQDPTVLDARMPLLKDALLRELAAMNGEEVRSSQGSDALRQALTADAQQIWGEEVVRRVVLTELLIN